MVIYSCCANIELCYFTVMGLYKCGNIQLWDYTAPVGT